MMTDEDTFETDELWILHKTGSDYKTDAHSIVVIEWAATDGEEREILPLFTDPRVAIAFAQDSEVRGEVSTSKLLDVYTIKSIFNNLQSKGTTHVEINPVKQSRRTGKQEEHITFEEFFAGLTETG